MKYNRLLPLLIPLIVLVLFEIFFFYPRMIYVCLVLANLLVFFTTNQFTKASDVSKSWWKFLILPSFFLTSLAAFTILIPNKFIVQILFILNSIFLYFYIRTIYYYLIQPAFYRNLSLENISSYGNFLTFFFVSSVIYGLQSFLNISIWPLMVIMVVVTALIVYQVLWINRIDNRPAFVYILISSLILVELAWSISFLPLNFNIAGLILAICYYILIGLVRHHLLEKLDKRTIELYLFFGFGSIIIILLTSRWM
jgi:hypothetical protein